MANPYAEELEKLTKLESDLTKKLAGMKKTPKIGGGWLKNILPRGSLAGAAATKLPQLALLAGAGYGGYKAGQGLMKWLQPQDWYYNPTAENQARQFGITQLSPYAAGILGQTGGVPKGATTAVAGEPTTAERVSALQALRDVGKTPVTPPGGGMPVRYETITEGGWIYSVGYDAQGNIVSRDPLGRAETPTAPDVISPFQQAQLTWQQQQAAQEQGWQQQQLAQERESQQQQMGWYREQAQMQQQEQERQFRSQLSANPMSWLQYASYTGEQPVIQPWMLPLMPQQYAGAVAGQNIPGWQGQGGSMANLPGMTTPSAQYWGRMGPTAQQQYMGYQQGQGGINPMETQFRLQSQAPPGGRNYGLTWGR